MREKYVVFKLVADTSVYCNYNVFCHRIKVFPIPVKVVYKNGCYINKHRDSLMVEDIKHSFVLDVRKEKVAYDLKEDYDTNLSSTSYGFPIPLSEFKKSEIAKQAFKKFKNNEMPEFIELSFDAKEAEEQLKEIGIDINIKKNRR